MVVDVVHPYNDGASFPTRGPSSPAMNELPGCQGIRARCYRCFDLFATWQDGISGYSPLELEIAF